MYSKNKMVAFTKRIMALVLAVFLFSIESFAEASVYYAPTQTPTINIPEYDYSDATKIIDTEQLATLNEDASSVNYVTVFNIVEDNGNYYCYDNGTMVTNAWRKISKTSYANICSVDAFTEPYIWAYFQSSGKAIKASSGNIKKTKINGQPYAFNEYGQLLKGFFNERGEMWDERTEEDPFYLIGDGNLYHADEASGVLTSGWYKLNGTTSRYENKTSIWMYFNPSTYRAVRATGNNYKKQIIDGRTYAFDDNGVMLTGFEPLQYNEQHGGNTTSIPYFGTDGAAVSSGFASVDMNDEVVSEIYGDSDEDITIYLSKNGKMYLNSIKKIGSNYYGFTDTGNVVRGMSVWDSNGFVSYLSNEDTNGKQFIIDGTYVDKNGAQHTLSSGQKVHYFDERGRRVTSVSKLEFADEVYTYRAENSGAHEGSYNKKYYVHGLLMKPANDAKYGVYIVQRTKSTYSMSELCNNSNVCVVDRNGTIVSGSSELRDDNDNYWLTSGSTFVNIYSVRVKKDSINKFRSTATSGSETWFNFGQPDARGYTCIEKYTENGKTVSSGVVSNYQVRMSSDSATNFYLS